MSLYESIYVNLLTVYSGVVLFLSAWFYLRGKKVGRWKLYLVVALAIQAWLLFYYGYLMHPHGPFPFIEIAIMSLVLIPVTVMGIRVGGKRAAGT